MAIAGCLALAGGVGVLLSPALGLLAVSAFAIGLCASAFGLARHAFMTTRVPLRYHARALSVLGGSFRLGMFAGPFIAAALLAATGTTDEFQLWRECGLIMGSWVAGNEAFAASSWGSSGNCGLNDPLRSVLWLDAAVAYQHAGGSWQLMDRNGDRIASMTVDGAPEPIPTVSADYTRPPKITDRTREHFARTVPLPASLTPAAHSAFKGRWVPASSSGGDAHVEFTEQASGRGRTVVTARPVGGLSILPGSFSESAAPAHSSGVRGRRFPHG